MASICHQKCAKVRSHIARPKKGRTHTHRTHTSKCFSHAHRTRASVRARVRVRIYFRNSQIADFDVCDMPSHDEKSIDELETPQPTRP